MQQIKRFFFRKTFIFPIVLFIIIAITNFAMQYNNLGPEKFQNRFMFLLDNNIRGFLPLIFLAIAQAIVLINGSIDLSIGNLMGVVAAFLVTQYSMDDNVLRFLQVFAMAIGIGVLAGALNGIFVSLVRIPPFITTYATSFVFSGIAMWILPRPGGNMPEIVTDFYRKTLPLGLPMGIWIIMVLMLLWVVFRNTRFGAHLYAIGSNEKAAFASGVSVIRHRMSVHMIAGFIAAFGALALVLITGSSDPRIGGTMTLDSIVAVVLGGTPFSGGIGGVVGPIFGVMILGFIRNIVGFARVDTWLQPLVDSLIILVALTSPSFIKLILKQLKNE
jgi:ribose transport system permease protein